MKNRRMRPSRVMETATLLRHGSFVYLAVSFLILTVTAIVYLTIDFAGRTHSGSFFDYLRDALPFLIWGLHLVGLGLLFLALRKCRACLLGPGKQLTEAMQKMSKGDLGWKLTLRRNDELADVADSVSNASRSLAERIGKIQSQVKGLAEVEGYLLDSFDTTRDINPYFIKALRKMSICTNRLHADIDEFQISLTVDTFTPDTPTTLTMPRRAQSLGGQ